MEILDAYTTEPNHHWVNPYLYDPEQLKVITAGTVVSTHEGMPVPADEVTLVFETDSTGGTLLFEGLEATRDMLKAMLKATERVIASGITEHSPHAWQRARFTGNMTCANCGLMPMDEDDMETECEGM